MTYELRDFETGNAIGSYPTMAAALDGSNVRSPVTAKRRFRDSRSSR